MTTSRHGQSVILVDKPASVSSLVVFAAASSEAVGVMPSVSRDSSDSNDIRPRRQLAECQLDAEDSCRRALKRCAGNHQLCVFEVAETLNSGSFHEGADRREERLQVLQGVFGEWSQVLKRWLESSRDKTLTERV